MAQLLQIIFFFEIIIDNTYLRLYLIMLEFELWEYGVISDMNIIILEGVIF